MPRLYTLVIRNSDGQYADVGGIRGLRPMTHAQAMTMKSKFSNEQQSRIMVKEVAS